MTHQEFTEALKTEAKSPLVSECVCRLLEKESELMSLRKSEEKARKDLQEGESEIARLKERIIMLTPEGQKPFDEVKGFESAWQKLSEGRYRKVY
jgi:chromosome segregation and condensation protein ScpB